jgi:hypothetical protein
MFSTSKVKLYQKFVWRMELARPKIIIKWLKYEINQSNRKSSEKSMFWTSKVKSIQKSVWELPDEMCSRDHLCNKPKLIPNKFNLKKNCLLFIEGPLIGVTKSTMDCKWRTADCLFRTETLFIDKKS